MNLLKWLFNSTGFVRRAEIAKGQWQIQRLKARIEDLSQQLRSIEMMSAAVGVELSGAGPFRLPLLTELKSLVTQAEDAIVAEFQSQDGKTVYAMFRPLMAAQIVNDYIAAATSAGLDPSIPINLPNSAGAFRLPVLSGYNGHFCPGSDVQILVFSSQDRRVFLPLLFETYEKLLRQFEAALLLNEQANSETEVSSGLWLPNSVRYLVRRL
jgi:hypothetical protein